MIAGVILYRIICVIVDLFLIGLALGLVYWAARETGRAVLRLRTGRRKDREWFAYIASKPRGPELLEWLREQRAAVRGHGCAQPIPRAVPDAELEQWEREEIDRMETFYADDGVNPHEQRRTTGDLS